MLAGEFCEYRHTRYSGVNQAILFRQLCIYFWCFFHYTLMPEQLLCVEFVLLSLEFTIF